MNDNTKKSSPMLLDAIMKAKTEKEKQSACSLVLFALEGRDNDLNKISEEHDILKAKYNNTIERFKDLARLLKIN